MEAERLADCVRQHCNIPLTNKSHINRKSFLNIEVNLTKLGKQLGIPLETKKLR
jgi:hypothetical protein